MHRPVDMIDACAPTEEIAGGWKPGQSSDPLGRPLGTRCKFSETANGSFAGGLDDAWAGLLVRVTA
jgi:hypothetical protein